MATLTVTWLALVGRAEASPSLTPAGVSATLVALAGGWIAAVVTSGLYDHRRAWSIQRDGQALIQAAVLTMVCGFALGTVVGAPPAILLAIIGVPPLLACAGIAARMGMKAFGERNRGAGATRYILVVGLGDAAREFATRIDERWWLRLEILGFLGEATEGERLPEATYLGTVDDLTRIAGVVIIVAGLLIVALAVSERGLLAVLNRERFGTAPLSRRELETLADLLRRLRENAGDFTSGSATTPR